MGKLQKIGQGKRGEDRRRPAGGAGGRHEAEDEPGGHPLAEAEGAADQFTPGLTEPRAPDLPGAGRYWNTVEVLDDHDVGEDLARFGREGGVVGIAL